MIEKQKLNYFILAGSSGTGKTSVLNHLRAGGYACVSEMARDVLTEQLAADGPALPSKSPLLFIQEMRSRCVEGFEKYSQNTSPVFFDRGMPDLVHYAIRFGIDPTEFLEASNLYRYNKNVFIFSPWEEIFVNDNERRMPFDKSVEFHEILKKVYLDLGYNLIEVPKGSVGERALFVAEQVRAYADVQQ